MGDDGYPFFKFYTKDWLSDFNVRCMDPAERGIYVDLLAFDWEEDGIPADPDRLAKVTGTDADAMRDAWETLADRFIPHPTKEGLVTNRRLASERQEIKDAQQKRSEAARKAARARWDGQEEQKDDADDAPASDPQSDRMPPRSREKSEGRDKRAETEERENNTPQGGAKASHSLGDWTTEYVPIITDALWLSDEPPDKSPDGWSLAAELKAIKSWRENRRSDAEIRAFLLGAAILRDWGELGGVEHNEGITCARLRYDSPYDVVDHWARFPHAYHKYEGREVGNYELEAPVSEAAEAVAG